MNWHATRDKLHAVRRAVFVEEQKVPEELEWDDADEHSHHVLAESDDGAPIGTGRLKLDCYIGRMAVVKEWRGRGVGAAILNRADRARAKGRLQHRCGCMRKRMRSNSTRATGSTRWAANSKKRASRTA